MKKALLRAVFGGFWLLVPQGALAQSVNIVNNSQLDAGPALPNGLTILPQNTGAATNWYSPTGVVEIVQVDGAGGYVNPNVPESDFSGSMAGTPQRFIRLSKANPQVRYEFTAPCTGVLKITFWLVDKKPKLRKWDEYSCFCKWS